MEIPQVDPSSLLLPLTEDPMPAPERDYCKWENTIGARKGELCGRICSFESEFCAAHMLVSMRRNAAVIEKKLEEPESESESEPESIKPIKLITKPIFKSSVKPIEIKPIEVKPIEVKPIEPIPTDFAHKERLLKLDLLTELIKLIRDAII